MVTLKDIAQIAGVAQGTVSRISNQNPVLRVTGETRERAVCITESLGYKKNTLRTASPAPTGQEKRVGIMQMFDTEELREDIYYLTLKNILDEEYFSR